ncbi:MAG: tetratricopeptide repeat protein [Candidatus Schekmanbacteria bacterium]|nr:tetratricopeptide repeat protein [Candidatus Schekmanbacteria bacterium]
MFELLIGFLAGVITLFTGWVFIEQYNQNKKNPADTPRPYLPESEPEAGFPDDLSPENTPWNVPLHSKSDFIGKAERLAELKRLLQDKGSVLITQSRQCDVWGGTGKTQTAVEYIYKYQDDYLGGVLWINCNQDVLSEFSLLPEIIGLNLPIETKYAKKCQQIKEYLQQSKRKTLLIFDDIDEHSYEQIYPYLPENKFFQMLFLTNCKTLNIANASFVIDHLSDEKALALLFQESGRPDQAVEEKDPALIICHILGNLPLALELAGKYLKQAEELGFGQFLDCLIAAGDLDLAVLQETDKFYSLDHVKSIRNLVAINHELMDNVQARKIMAALTCFAGANINPEIISTVCDIDWKSKREDFWELTGLLEKYALLQVQQDDRLTVHRLIQEAFCQVIPPNELNVVRRSYIGILQNWFDSHNNLTQLKITTKEIPHVLTAARLAASEGIFPQSYDLSLALGKYYNCIGLYQESIKWSKQGEAEVKKHAAQEYHRLGAACVEIGLALNALGEFKRAVSYFEKGLVFEKEHFGEKHPQISSTLNNLGMAYDSLKQYKKAVGYYKQALEIDKEYFGERNPNVAARLNNLGGVWYSLGDHKQAAECFEQAIKIWREVHGDRHPQVSAGLNNLGMAWKSLGEYEKAIEHYKQALSIDQQCFGERHPKVAIDLNNLGRAWHSLGQTGKARQCAQQAYSINLEFFGQEQPGNKTNSSSRQAQSNEE